MIAMKSKISLAVMCGAVFLFLVLCNTPAFSEDDTAAYYRGKTIKLVVGYGPGGGYDTLARVIAPYLEEQTGATVIVENRPGGGGLVALNQVFQGQADGLTIMLVNSPAAVLAQILGIDAVRYDLLQASWLGRVSAERHIVLVNKDTPFISKQWLLNEERAIKWAGGSKADNLSDAAACFSEALQLNSKIIIGYKGSKEAALSAMRGETDGIVITESSAKKYVQSDRLIPLVVLDRQRSLLFPEIPTVFEWVSLNEEQAGWIDFRADISATGRALLMAPLTPIEQVEYLTGLFKTIFQDKTFRNDVVKKGYLVDYAEASILYDLLEKTLGSVKGERLAKIRSVVLDKYYR